MMNLPAPHERNAILVDRRNRKMACSPHAYVRGNTTRFYEWLHSPRGHTLPQGPAIWICGDCHLGNLGPLADANGDVEVRIRDFDQTTIGNPAHDLVRLALSLAAAARGSNLPGVVIAHMMEHLMEGYEHALAPDEERPGIKKPELVREAIRVSNKRSWKELARERIADLKPNIPLGKNFWPLSDEEKNEVARLFEQKEIAHLVTTLKIRDEDAKIKVLDAAYWVKGCSSLGLLRYAVLVGVGGTDYCLIDIKEAAKAAAPRYRSARMPRDNARRVVEGARQMEPALGERMLAQRFLDHGVFIRELLPQDLKLEIERLSTEEATVTARYLAYAVGLAHARQMDESTRAAWARELKQKRSKTLATPGWLWANVVQLVASHEAGYLEHCRRYALGE